MMDRYTAPPPSLVTQPTSVMMSAIEIVEEIVTENISNDHEEGVSMIDNTTSMNDEQPQLSKRRGSGSNNMQQVSTLLLLLSRLFF